MTPLEILKQEVQTSCNVFVEKICKAEHIRELDGLFEQLKTSIELLRRQYQENARKLFVKMQIEKLNSQEFISDEDCRNLVLGGLDDLSDCRILVLYEKMQELLGKDFADGAIDSLTLAFKDNNKYKTRAMRWICRGLNVDHAIAKIQYDALMFGN